MSTYLGLFHAVRFDLVWFGLVLWHINHYWLFKAKSCLFISRIYMICKHFVGNIFKWALAHFFFCTLLNGFKYCYVIIIIMSCHRHGYPWPSLATSPYRSSPLAGLQGCIPYPHIAAGCMFEHLPPITKTIQVRQTRHAGHCWRSRDELISDVLLWTPTYGQAKAGLLCNSNNLTSVICLHTFK